MVLDGAGNLILQELAIEFDIEQAALLRVNAAGVCGTDIKKVDRLDGVARILGHEIVGEIVWLPRSMADNWKMSAGDRVVVEEYLPCGVCANCRRGQHRYCPRTDAGATAPLRFGSSPLAVSPGLWGGYSEYLYLPSEAMVHRIPDGVSDGLASLALPLANGIQWLQFDVGVGSGQRIAILGPGQQGLGCLVAALQAGADEVDVIGLPRDRERLAMARALGARTSMQLGPDEESDESSYDVVVDVSVGSDASLALALRLVRPGGTVCIAASRQNGVVNAATVMSKHLTLRGQRGHTYAAVEAALGLLDSRRYPLELLTHESYALAELPLAIEHARASKVIHAFIEPQR